MKKNKNLTSLEMLKEQASKIKTSNKLNTVADTDFFQKKMEKGIKTLSVTELPK